MLVMVLQNSKVRGRRKIADKPTSVTIRVDASVIELADSVAADIERTSVAGLPTTRPDVLRAALARGVKAMRADVDQRLNNDR